jgi:S1-C subfamily serine protease
MNAVDVVLIVLVVAFAVAGLRQGFVVSVVSFAGFVVGAAAGLVLMPLALGGNQPGPARSLVALGGVALLAVTAQTLAGWAGVGLRRRITPEPARRADAVGGALVGTVSVLLAVWLLGSVALRDDPGLPFADQARDSRVLAAVDKVIPVNPDDVFAAFGRLLDTTGFPAVFSDLTQERPAPVAAPDATVAETAGVLRAEASTVKVAGDAYSCSRRIEGSGFVFAPQHVMTNAHVLAGVSDPYVYVGGSGRGYRARVVEFDPNLDVAVLYVPGLDLPPLTFGPLARTGASAAAIGYPGDGPRTVSPARVRGITKAIGEDVYGSGQVVREVYSLRVSVHPGNSGGPLVDPGGAVLGVVFAASRTDAQTGYALTAAQVTDAARAYGSARAEVETGRCA